MSQFKKNRKKKKRKGDSSSDDEDRDTTSSPTTKQKKLSFKEKKELQRKQKDDKRRSKQKCRLCNQIGHLRKECPGIEDGGSGESKYKQKGKSKRDHATYKKSSGKNTKKSRGSKNRGNKNKYEQETNTISLSFPEQFTAPIDDSKNTSFPMIDCSTNVAATIAQINNLNHGIDSKQEYSQLLSTQTCQYYSGVITTYIIPKARKWNVGGPHWLKKVDERIFFVVGIDINIDSSLVPEMIVDVLSDPFVVGLYVVLDYKEKDTNDKMLQMERLKTMCVAAEKHNVPLQVSITGEPTSKPVLVETLTMPAAKTIAKTKETTDTTKTETETETEETDPYLEAMKAFVQHILNYSTDLLSIHMSSWSGNCENMSKLIRAFPKMMIGLHGGVSFTKSTLLHSCAYDIPLDRLLLETSSPQYIPSQVSKLLGRDAMNHGGLLPFVAEAIAIHKTTKSTTVRAIDIARASSNNASIMYPRILNTLPLKIPKEKQQENLSDEEQQQEEEDITRLLLSTKEKLQPEEKDCYYSATNIIYGVVTGGNRGIGLALIPQLLGEDLNLHLFMGCRILAEGIAAVSSLETQFHSRITPVLLDVTSTKSLTAAFATISAIASNGLSLLINNAGILGENDTPFEDVIAVNFQGVIDTTTTFLPLLLNSSLTKCSTVITTSSSCGVRLLASLDIETQNELLNKDLTIQGLKEMVALLKFSTDDIYSVTKLGVNIFTLILSRKYNIDRLRILAVSPGFTNTDMCQNYDGDRIPKEIELGASVFKEALFGIGKNKTGIFVKQKSTAGTKLKNAVSVITDWK